jgi:hypothetical protein
VAQINGSRDIALLEKIALDSSYHPALQNAAYDRIDDLAGSSTPGAIDALKRIDVAKGRASA